MSAKATKKVLWRAYLQGNAGWCINERWTLRGFARYDWSEERGGSVGPGPFSANLSGWSLGAGATWSFQ